LIEYFADDWKNMTADFSPRQDVDLPANSPPIVSIGMGGIVHDSHYPAYQKAGFSVAGGYDANPEQARKMAQKFNVPVIYESLSEAIQNAPADAVFDLAVPGNVVLDVLRQLPDNRAVLIQKPMGENLEEARAIRDLCKTKNLTGAVNFQMRYAPYIVAARDMIAQGIIGDVYDVEVRMQVYMPWHLWSFLYGKPRMEILYHSIHYVDLVRSFLGNPQGVYAKTLGHPASLGLAQTRSTIILDYGDSIRANIMTNHAHIFGAEKQQSYVKWEGAKGAIQVTAGLNMDYPTGRPDAIEYITLQEGIEPTWKSIQVQGSWFPDAFIGTMSSLMRYVNRESDVLPTSVEDAFQTMAVVEAAYISSEQGGTPIPE
jgi:predicted dehydrogenase